MVTYAPEPMEDTDWLGHPLDDDDGDWEDEPPSGWLEPAWESNRRLIINGTPPPPALVREILTKPDITGLLINRLRPEFADLHWLQPLQSADSPMREIQISSVSGKLDLSPLRSFQHIERFRVEPEITRVFDFADWTPPIKELSIRQGSRAKYRNISMLQQVEILAIDLPGSDISYIENLPTLKSLILTAARKIQSLPLAFQQPLEQVTVHQSPSLDLEFLSKINSTLVEMQLDGIKRLDNARALASCGNLRSLVIENCGPEIDADDLLELMRHGSLEKLVLIGGAWPCSESERERLEREAPAGVKGIRPESR